MAFKSAQFFIFGPLKNFSEIVVAMLNDITMVWQHVACMAQSTHYRYNIDLWQS